MNCNVIATGSTGNAVILEDIVLIDCGVPYKALEAHAKALKLVLLSHCHSDHFKPATLRRLAWERPTLRFACCEWLVQPLLAAGVPARNIDVLVPGEWYHYSSVLLSPFPLFHDVDNCGYKIHMDGKKALYATDTGYLDVEAKDYDLLMIEANHREAEIQERIQRKLETGEFVYEYRAAAGHLSREKADAWLAQNATPGKSKVVFLHGHKEE